MIDGWRTGTCGDVDDDGLNVYIVLGWLIGLGGGSLVGLFVFVFGR